MVRHYGPAVTNQWCVDHWRSVSSERLVTVVVVRTISTFVYLAQGCCTSCSSVWVTDILLLSSLRSQPTCYSLRRQLSHVFIAHYNSL